jgi:enoyl-CoA hydratase/carnithine racemase
MPTVALVNGHAFAGGIMLAMYHDYRVFNPTRGFLCLNELDLGVPLKPAMSSIFRQKITSPHVYRSLVLEAKRFGGNEALQAGLVDGLGGIDEALALVKERKLVDKPKTGVYGVLKSEMYRETLGYLEGHDANEKRDEENRKKEDRRAEEGKSRVVEWERNVKKAKL